MAIELKTSKKETKATPITKKSNLASKEHEVLLQWLIENREGVCNVLFGRDADWFKEACATAIKGFHVRRDSLLKGLERGAEDESLPPDYRSACAAKLKLAKAFFKKVGAPLPPGRDPASCPVISEWNAQARVFTRTDCVNGKAINAKPAGFVDLQALLAIPDRFEVNCFDSVGSLGTSWHASEPDGVSEVADLEMHTPVWGYDRRSGLQYHRAWFDVWVELPPIGEILQHLKRLSELNAIYYEQNLPNSSGRIETSVVLVVPAISESLQAIIEHEGFDVISRVWYESD